MWNTIYIPAIYSENKKIYYYFDELLEMKYLFTIDDPRRFNNREFQTKVLPHIYHSQSLGGVHFIFEDHKNYYFKKAMKCLTETFDDLKEEDCELCLLVYELNKNNIYEPIVKYSKRKPCKLLINEYFEKVEYYNKTI